MTDYLALFRSMETDRHAHDKIAKIAKIPREANFGSSVNFVTGIESGKDREAVAVDPSVSDEQSDSFDERAAIAAYDGGLPVEWAEGLARLSVMPPPRGWATKRWRVLVDDAAQFADRWGAIVSKLGWTVPDVFGVHPDSPHRVDVAGLVALLDGNEVAAVTAQSARIQARSGATQTYVRRDRGGAVPAWDLVQES